MRNSLHTAASAAQNIAAAGLSCGELFDDHFAALARTRRLLADVALASSRRQPYEGREALW